MTREELRDYVDEQRTLNNIPYHVYSALIDGIDTLEQESILDKIKAEIEKTADEEQKYDKKWAVGLRYAVKIIDKYETESE